MTDLIYRLFIFMLLILPVTSMAAESKIDETSIALHFSDIKKQAAPPTMVPDNRDHPLYHNEPPASSAEPPDNNRYFFSQKEVQQQYESLVLSYEKWRTEYLVRIYESQFCMTKMYAYVLAALNCILIVALVILAHTDRKNTDWILISLKPLAIKIKTGAFVFMLLIVMLFFSYYFFETMYPIQ